MYTKSMFKSVTLLILVSILLASACQSAPAPAPQVKPDIDHLRRAWPVVLEAVKKRQAGLSAVLGEGSPESLEGDTLVISFPAGYSFQANQVVKAENPRVIGEALREVTGKELRITSRLAPEGAQKPAAPEEDATLLSRDELIRVLKREFDAELLDEEPPPQGARR